MTPVTQTKLQTPNHSGNGVAAALASLLEFPLRAVPPFGSKRYSGSRRFSMDEVKSEGRISQLHWWNALWFWLDQLDYAIDHVETLPEDAPEYVIAIGPSPRFEGLKHAVVWSAPDDTLAHDPHPERAGINGQPEDFWIIRKQ